MPLPFIEAVKDPAQIRWRFGPISSPQAPPVVLEHLPVCGNCHSFPRDGRTLAMDVDYANDKGSSVLAPGDEQMRLAVSNMITWGDFQRAAGAETFGLLSQISPDHSPSPQARNARRQCHYYDPIGSEYWHICPIAGWPSCGQGLGGVPIL